MLAKLVPSTQKVKIEASLEECRHFLEFAKEQAQGVKNTSIHGLPKVVRENLKKLENEWTSIENALAAVFEKKNKKQAKNSEAGKSEPVATTSARPRDAYGEMELRKLVGEPLRPWQQTEGAWQVLHWTERESNAQLREAFFEALAEGKSGADLKAAALMQRVNEKADEAEQ